MEMMLILELGKMVGEKTQILSTGRTAACRVLRAVPGTLAIERPR
jgi:hypothetical protein